MFENVTYEEILYRMLARVPDSYDKREGSVIYDALAPAAVELKQAYIQLDVVLNEVFADTASREYLIKRAAERGVKPFEASVSVVRGVFEPSDIEIEIGSRWSIDDVTFFVSKKVSDGNYELTCETAGNIGNVPNGTLLPIDYVDPKLTSAKIVGIEVYGEDEEETETFRNRYFQSLSTEAFGGNRADYRSKTLSIGGVGAVKVYNGKEWNGGGTVKLVILDSKYGVPTTSLVETIQNEIDPVENQGDGYGVAPIGHFVTVVPADSTKINIETTLTYDALHDWSMVKNNVFQTIDDYFQELNESWEDLSNITVRVAQIESRILNVEGIIDISNTLINGVSHNIVVDKDSIVVRGTVNGE